MKRWQQERNYRIKRNSDGKIEGYFITVDETEVEVTKEVFDAYAQEDRRERYRREREIEKELLSLEQMQEDNVPESVYVGSVRSSEDDAFALYEAEELDRLCRSLVSAISRLDSTDRELITELFVKRVSVREYASRLGVTHRAVLKRRDRILKQLKIFLENF